MEFVVPFGKYRGKTLPWVLENDLKYTKWVAEEFDNKGIRKMFQDALDGLEEANRVIEEEKKVSE
jgi:hypothetical protein